MDKMLQAIEAVLHAQESPSPFSKYLIDISPAQGRVIEDYIRRFRSQILRVLAWQQIELLPPTIPATRSIITHLHFIDIAISELRPYSMRGSGPMSESTASELMGVLRELASISQNMMGYMHCELSESLQQRIEKLTSEGKASELLQRIERVVTTRGLVEYRPRLEMLLGRLEDPTFEVAVFGRVSSGKSSFLNALLGMDLLPVGANPITAVPTRIRYGHMVEARIRLGSASAMTLSLQRFQELVSEAGNPGNQEGVRWASVEAPCPRLSEGIVLVDTPGFGSLALRGTRETLAYLPSCDLALLLVDAGNTLTPEDIGTLRLVLEAGIPALILLSKADLLREADRDVSMQYIRTQIERELRTQLPIYAVSSLEGYRTTVDEFYERELEPRFCESHGLRKQSVDIKLARLQYDVVTTVETKIRRAESATSAGKPEFTAMERSLAAVSAQIGAAERMIMEKILALESQAAELINCVADQYLTSLGGRGSSVVAVADLCRAIEDSVQRQVGEMVGVLQQTTHAVVGKVAGIGFALKSSGIPDEREILAVIRDAPRFELPSQSGQIELGMWRHLGPRFVRRRLVQAMQTAMQPLLHSELMAYGHAMEVWTKSVEGNIQVAINSFADVYRASLQEAAGLGGPIEDIDALRADIAALSV
ncbi:MAG: dynamin family protein [Acidobacteriaceae bacterium]